MTLDPLIGWFPIDGVERALTMFCVYAYPAEYPLHWVVRRCFVLETGEVRWDVLPRLAPDLEQARELVPAGLFCQPRHPGDEPHIIEAWF